MLDLTDCPFAIHAARGHEPGRGHYHRLAARCGSTELGSVRVRNGGFRQIELTHLVVQPRFRGREIGRALLRTSADMAVVFGARFISLSSEDDGTGRLDAWYRRSGFVDCGFDGLGQRRFRGAAGALLARLDRTPLQLTLDPSEG